MNPTTLQTIFRSFLYWNIREEGIANPLLFSFPNHHRLTDDVRSKSSVAIQASIPDTIGLFAVCTFVKLNSHMLSFFTEMEIPAETC